MEKEIREYISKIDNAVNSFLQTKAQETQEESKAIIERFNRIRTREMLNTTVSYAKGGDLRFTLTAMSNPEDKRGRRYASYNDEGTHVMKGIGFITDPMKENERTIPNELVAIIKRIDI